MPQARHCWQFQRQELFFLNYLGKCHSSQLQNSPSRLTFRLSYGLTTCGLFLSEHVIASTYLSTTVALICIVAFRTAPPISGLSCFCFRVVYFEYFYHVLHVYDLLFQMSVFKKHLNLSSNEKLANTHLLGDGLARCFIQVMVCLLGMHSFPLRLYPLLS